VSYYIALGLKRHGYYGLARDLEARIISLHKSTKLLPEYGSGSNDASERLVTTKIVISDDSAPEKVYSAGQPAQEVQAWTAAAVLAIKSDKSVFDAATDEQKRHFEEYVLQRIKT